MGLFYPSQDDLCLLAYCDADWGSCPFIAKSLLVLLFFLQRVMNETPSQSIDHRPWMSRTTCGLSLIHCLIAALHVPVPRPNDLFCDNTPAKYIAESKVFHEKNETPKS